MDSGCQWPEVWLGSFCPSSLHPSDETERFSNMSSFRKRKLSGSRGSVSLVGPGRRPHLSRGEEGEFLISQVEGHVSGRRVC